MSKQTRTNKRLLEQVDRTNMYIINETIHVLDMIRAVGDHDAVRIRIGRQGTVFDMNIYHYILPPGEEWKYFNPRYERGQKAYVNIDLSEVNHKLQVLEDLHAETTTNPQAIRSHYQVLDKSGAFGRTGGDSRSRRVLFNAH